MSFTPIHQLSDCCPDPITQHRYSEKSSPLKTFDGNKCESQSGDTHGTAILCDTRRCHPRLLHNLTDPITMVYYQCYWTVDFNLWCWWQRNMGLLTGRHEQLWQLDIGIHLSMHQNWLHVSSIIHMMWQNCHRTFWVNINLYLYITHYSAHPPRVITWLLLRCCYRIYTLWSDPYKIHQHLQNLYKGIILREYKLYQVNPFLWIHKEFIKWCLQQLSTHSAILTSKDDVTRKTSLLHLWYNPRDISSNPLQHAWFTHLKTHAYEKTLSEIPKSQVKILAFIAWLLNMDAQTTSEMSYHIESLMHPT